MNSHLPVTSFHITVEDNKVKRGEYFYQLPQYSWVDSIWSQRLVHALSADHFPSDCGAFNLFPIPTFQFRMLGTWRKTHLSTKERGKGGMKYSSLSQTSSLCFPPTSSKGLGILLSPLLTAEKNETKIFLSFMAVARLNSIWALTSLIFILNNPTASL